MKTKLSIIITNIVTICASLFLAIPVVQAASAAKLKIYNFSPALTPATLMPVQEFKVDCSALLNKFVGSPSLNDDAEIVDKIVEASKGFDAGKDSFSGVVKLKNGQMIKISGYFYGVVNNVDDLSVMKIKTAFPDFQQ